jgi:hypothetical protein
MFNQFNDTELKNQWGPATSKTWVNKEGGTIIILNLRLFSCMVVKLI